MRWYGSFLFGQQKYGTDPIAVSYLPQVSLNGNLFYIRSGSLSESLTTKVWADKVSLTWKTRRLIGTACRSWAFTIALRSWAERLALESILSETPTDFTLPFIDVRGDSYTVTIDEAGAMTPVVDNTDFFNCQVRVREVN